MLKRHKSAHNSILVPFGSPVIKHRISTKILLTTGKVANCWSHSSLRECRHSQAIWRLRCNATSKAYFLDGVFPKNTLIKTAIENENI